MEEIIQLAARIMANERTIESFKLEFKDKNIDIHRIQQMRQENQKYLSRIKELVNAHHLA
jgi:cell shape-determining protein MreC